MTSFFGGVIFVMRGERIQILLKAGHQMAFHWRAGNDPTFNAGWLGSFVIFSGDPDQYC